MTVLASARHVCVLKGTLTAKALPGLETTRVCIKRDSRGRFCPQGEGQLQPKDGTISATSDGNIYHRCRTRFSRTQPDNDGSYTFKATSAWFLQLLVMQTR